MIRNAMATHDPGFGRRAQEPATGQTMLHLTRLRVSEFRSIASADLTLSAGAVVLLGPNGSGKTNVLEAISFLAPGRGLHQAKLSDVTRRGSNAGTPWAVSAEIAGGDATWRVGTGLIHDALGRDRRQFRLEGEPASGAEIGNIVRLVWLTPTLERLFEESSSVRRRFLDRLVSGLEPGHSTHLAKYERALSERLRLLKEERADPEWLASLETLAATEGVVIAAARVRAVKSIAASIETGGPWADDAFPKASLALEGMIEATLMTASEGEAEGVFREALAQSRPRDAAAGRSLTGPHRSDLKVGHAQKNNGAESASTGEQKALLLNILLAHVRLVAKTHGAAPLVLLDEIAAHLDAGRRTALFSALASFGAQMFLSGTDERVFAELPTPQIFELERGLVRARGSSPFPRT